MGVDEDKQEGLGDRFIKQANLKIKQVIQSPERYPEKKRSFRETKIDAFPYLLIYKISNRKKVITIIFVFHTRQNPKVKYPANYHFYILYQRNLTVSSRLGW